MKLTEEQKKEQKRERNRRYYKANKERVLAEKKRYYKENKDSVRRYYEVNKEAIATRKKEHYNTNRERVLTQQKERYRANTLNGLFIVYCLPNTDVPYVGITHSPTNRMYSHKSHHNRDISDWFILKVCKTREEALKVESEYHKQGYAGEKGCN